MEAGFAGLAIGFNNRNADFSLYSNFRRLQGIKKGTVYMHVMVYGIHEMESAVGKCKVGSVDRNAVALHVWDEGVVSSRRWIATANLPVVISLSSMEYCVLSSYLVRRMILALTCISLLRHISCIP